jgi:plasmid stabilization system protein ParE
MRKAFLHRKVEEDAREIALYIAEDNPEAADAFRVALERIREMLADLPEIGSIRGFIEFRISNGYKSFSRKPIFEALSSMCPISIIYAKLNNNKELAGLRMLRIPKFEKYLIFYRPVPEGTEIIRVLHAARDISSIFGERVAEHEEEQKSRLAPALSWFPKMRGFALRSSGLCLLCHPLGGFDPTAPSL